MKFQFKVKVNDQDYLEYNTFWQLRSPYGKKQVKMCRILLTVLVGIYILLLLISGGFTAESFLGTFPMLIALFLVQVFLTKLLS